MKTPYTSSNPRRDAFYCDISSKVVTIVGLGGGAEIALRMLQSGVTKMHLYDFDTLDAGNLVRHICGFEYIGENKAVATKRLLDSYAGISAEASEIIAHTENIFDSELAFIDIVAQSDLVICGTDTEASRYLIGRITKDEQVDAIFVSMFEGGMGGEVFASTPRTGACYECLMHHQGHKDFIRKYNITMKKGDCTSSRDTKAMPGLGIDQSFLCSLASRKALDLLLVGTKHTLPPVGSNWIIFSLYGIPSIHEEHVSSLMLPISKHSDCSCAQI